MSMLCAGEREGFSTRFGRTFAVPVKSPSCHFSSSNIFTYNYSALHA